MSTRRWKWFLNTPLWVGVLVGMFLAFSSHAQSNEKCGLEGAWKVYDSYPKKPSADGNIEHGDILYIGGDESNTWNVMLERTSADGDMIPMCDYAAVISDKHLTCYYDDVDKRKTFTVDLIKTREVSESECKENYPERPENTACVEAACVIKWQNETVTDASITTRSPPNDGDGTGGKN